MSEWLPEGFVARERKRVFHPDDSFARRVVDQIGPVRSSAALWDFVPALARPMVAAAMVFVLAMLSLQAVFPPRPQVGVVDEYLSVDWAPEEEWLYGNAEIPEGQDLLLEISVLEGF